MTPRLLKSLAKLYDSIYVEDSYKRLKVVAFLIYKGKIVNFGINSSKTSPMQFHYRQKTSLASIENFMDKEHAEINCLRRTYFGEFNMRDIELVVISKRKNSAYRLARPCPICMAAIKDYGIHNIWYSTNEGAIVKEFV